MEEVNTTPRPLYPQVWPGIHCIGGWVGPGPVWTGKEKLASTGIRSADRPAGSESLYRLSYMYICIKELMCDQQRFVKHSYRNSIKIRDFRQIRTDGRGVHTGRLFICLPRNVHTGRLFNCLPLNVHTGRFFICLPRNASNIWAIICGRGREIFNLVGLLSSATNIKRTCRGIEIRPWERATALSCDTVLSGATAAPTLCIQSSIASAVICFFPLSAIP